MIWRHHSEDRSDYSTTVGWTMAPLKGIDRSLTWTPKNGHLEEKHRFGNPYVQVVQVSCSTSGGVG